MSAEAAVIAMLLANTALAALVDSDSVQPGQLSQAPTLPALVVNQISSVAARINVKEGAYEQVTSRVQVTAFADTYDQVKVLLTTVRQACGNRRGTFGGVSVRNCRVSLDGPDMQTDDDQMFVQTLDLSLAWIRAL